LGLRVNQIFIWLLGKGGKIDMMGRRGVAVMASRPTPLLRWVGGKLGDPLATQEGMIL
jgi:hypothetical protein